MARDRPTLPTGLVEFTDVEWRSGPHGLEPDFTTQGASMAERRAKLAAARHRSFDATMALIRAKTREEVARRALKEAQRRIFRERRAWTDVERALYRSDCAPQGADSVRFDEAHSHLDVLREATLLEKVHADATAAASIEASELRAAVVAHHAARAHFAHMRKAEDRARVQIQLAERMLQAYRNGLMLSTVAPQVNADIVEHVTGTGEKVSTAFEDNSKDDFDELVATTAKLAMSPPLISSVHGGPSLRTDSYATMGTLATQGIRPSERSQVRTQYSPGSSSSSISPFSLSSLSESPTFSIGRSPVSSLDAPLTGSPGPAGNFTFTQGMLFSEGSAQSPSVSPSSVVTAPSSSSTLATALNTSSCNASASTVFEIQVVGPKPNAWHAQGPPPKKQNKGPGPCCGSGNQGRAPGRTPPRARYCQKCGVKEEPKKPKKKFYRGPNGNRTLCLPCNLFWLVNRKVEQIRLESGEAGTAVNFQAPVITLQDLHAAQNNSFIPAQVGFGARGGSARSAAGPSTWKSRGVNSHVQRGPWSNVQRGANRGGRGRRGRGGANNHQAPRGGHKHPRGGMRGRGRARGGRQNSPRAAVVPNSGPNQHHAGVQGQTHAASFVQVVRGMQHVRGRRGRGGAQDGTMSSSVPKNVRGPDVPPGF